MNTTYESSGPTAAELERRLGSVIYAQIAPVFIEAAQYRAEKAQAKQRGKHANKVKASRTRRAIVAMVWRHRRQIRAWPEGKRESRAEHIRICIEGAIALSDSEPKMWMKLRKPPSWRTIDNVLKSLKF